MERKTIILIVAVGIIFMLVLLLLFFRLSAGKSVSAPQFLSSLNPTTVEELNIRMDQVEKAVAKLIQQIGSQGSNQTPGTPVNSSDTSSSLDARLNNIESTLASLNVTVNQLKTGNTQTTTTTGQSTSSNQSPLYIPLGWQGSISNREWTSLTTQSFKLNPADYPGMKSVQFGVNLQVFQGNGTAYARLYNSTDNVNVYGSDMSTTAQNYVWVTSNNFQVPAAEKTYILQLMTNTGYASMVQNAWLRINF